MTRDDQDELVEAEVECAWSDRRGVRQALMNGRER
jgi:hypothetical protein